MASFGASNPKYGGRRNQMRSPGAGEIPLQSPETISPWHLNCKRTPLYTLLFLELTARRPAFGLGFPEISNWNFTGPR